MKAIARCVAVAVAIFSWIAISNHCAVGAVTAKPETIAAECPFHSKPAKKKEQPAVQQCCKTLRAVLAKLAKHWTRDDTQFSDVDLTSERLLVFPAAPNVAPLLLDTGPPGKTCFIELIGSVRAHAPPVSL